MRALHTAASGMLAQELNVQVIANNFAYNWQAGQNGYAVLFTVRNQDGRCPWCQVDHITFEQNVVQHSGGGMMPYAWGCG